MSNLPADALPWAQGLALVLVLGLATALLVGVMLLVRPAALFAINQRLSRWVDTQAAFSALDEPRHLERFFYRHHRVLGLLVVLGALTVLSRWAMSYDRSGVMAMLGPRWIASGMDWIPLALEALLVALHVLILAVGAVIFVRPSLLKGFEKAANRWQEAPGAARLDSKVADLDGTVEGHPRVSGLLLVLSATWCLLALAPVIADLLRR